MEIWVGALLEINFNDDSSLLFRKGDRGRLKDVRAGNLIEVDLGGVSTWLSVSDVNVLCPKGTVEYNFGLHSKCESCEMQLTCLAGRS